MQAEFGFWTYQPVINTSSKSTIMDLVFFDLDGTLLDGSSSLSPFTIETLQKMDANGIAYTVATGRTMLSASPILEGQFLSLPHIYNNGVTLWDPKQQRVEFENLLTENEIDVILAMALAHGITPFVNTVERITMWFITARRNMP